SGGVRVRRGSGTDVNIIGHCERAAAMLDAKRIVVDPVGVNRVVILSSSVIETHLRRGMVRDVTSEWFESSPSPSAHRRPDLVTGRTHRIPNGSVVREIE